MLVGEYGNLAVKAQVGSASPACAVTLVVLINRDSILPEIGGHLSDDTWHFGIPFGFGKEKGLGHVLVFADMATEVSQRSCWSKIQRF